jgi:hypothetical protein
MKVERRASGADVKIHTSRVGWMPLLGVAGFVFASGVLEGANGWHVSAGQLILSGVLVAEALWIRTFGVVLTEEAAIVRGLRWQNLPWKRVQAVLPFDELGSRRVCLILESGRRVNLRAPTTMLGLGAARYEQDFHRIGQWWLAHRGQSWRPLRPEAPPLPVQGSRGSTMTGA